MLPNKRDVKRALLRALSGRIVLPDEEDELGTAILQSSLIMFNAVRRTHLTNEEAAKVGAISCLIVEDALTRRKGLKILRRKASWDAW